MTPTAHYTVRLYAIHPHPEARLGDQATTFGVCCYWLPGPSSEPSIRRLRSDGRLATELFYSVIPRAVYEEVGMRVDNLSSTPNATWRGVACSTGRVRFGLIVEEWPRPPGEASDENRPTLPCEMQVLIPDEDPPDAPGGVLLGSSLLVGLQAQILLDYLFPGSGRILISLAWRGPAGQSEVPAP
jgi:hypothetical protein